ncbi:hypothetical protein [Mycolicibacterium litorale]|uniref:Membrane protein n=1 Tax=Mycolicibacterium litorale TaxID=758802 RepID=A0AAD1ING4_9MYCO|nr:hypothetical protein [Mycolicibacterium litorale]MCV7416785.1 hypothetical protein [Mycolicibacterium litorale]TDY04570.1 hypothetical protein BCL50_3345 [Mycolicibacterium litorale]BBY17996.1 membrane protein [Mycolicibacterium litorale]
MPQQQDKRAAKLTGLALAGTGLAHFARPQLFEPITVPAFPQNTRRHIYTNGSIETLVGLALAGRKTRKLGVAGLLGYLAYLAGNTVRKR